MVGGRTDLNRMTERENKTEKCAQVDHEACAEQPSIVVAVAWALTTAHEVAAPISSTAVVHGHPGLTGPLAVQNAVISNGRTIRHSWPIAYCTCERICRHMCPLLISMHVESSR